MLFRSVSQVEHVFTVSNLDWMVKGGRINKSIGHVGDILNIKPLVDVQDGKMEILKIVRGRKKALHEIVDLVVERSKGYPVQTIGLAHSDDEETVKTLESMLTEAMPYCDFVTCEIGCVLSTHLGIGGVGAFFFREE